jgi:multicomponent Na+:H+ antiporter subunit G
MVLTDIIIVLLLIAGGAFAFVAGLGVYRMNDVLIRMHASTKAGTLGCGLVLVGVAVHFGDVSTVSRAIAAIVFLLVTAPVAAHMIGRAAYRAGVPLWWAEGKPRIDRWGAHGTSRADVGEAPDRQEQSAALGHPGETGDRA